MRLKFRHILLGAGLLIGLGLAWVHFQRIDTDIANKVQMAEDDRHDFVISHDFGLLKEKLIETHRDYWKANERAEHLARWEFGGTLALALIIILLSISEFTRKRKD